MWYYEKHPKKLQKILPPMVKKRKKTPKMDKGKISTFHTFQNLFRTQSNPILKKVSDKYQYLSIPRERHQILKKGAWSTFVGNSEVYPKSPTCFFSEKNHKFKKNQYLLISWERCQILEKGAWSTFVGNFEIYPKSPTCFLV